MDRYIEELIERYAPLEVCAESVQKALDTLIASFEKGGKLMICGNGGSAADAGHIAGEMMKGFLKKRPISEENRQKMREKNPHVSEDILDKLQVGLPAIALTDATVVTSAFCNDVDPMYMFAQQVLALGKPEDVLIAISTSGGSVNVDAAVQTAKALGIPVIGLTGARDCRLAKSADIPICVPATETYKIQEYHLPVYHVLCAATEDHFFKI